MYLIMSNNQRLKHEHDVHGGKKVKIQYFGATSDLFAAVKSRQNKQLLASLIYIFYKNNICRKLILSVILICIHYTLVNITIYIIKFLSFTKLNIFVLIEIITKILYFLDS